MGKGGINPLKDRDEGLNSCWMDIATTKEAGQD